MNVALASSSAAFRRSAARSVLRRPNGARFNSTSSEKKAQDALAGAQKTALKTWERLAQFLGPAGEKLGNLLGGTCCISFLSLSFR
jgi:F-type H+-transporting ATPase subunit g